VLLNRIEKAIVNNPIRAALQRRFEARRLIDLGGRIEGGWALEVGCGRGAGVELILNQFGAGRVDAFDLDPQMVALARRRLAPRGDRVRLWVGDVCRIPVPEQTYDAVFDFGIIHHVPNWRDAVAEIHRVLRPGGRFYAEEVLARFILNPVVRRLLDHPLEDRFDARQFAAALERHGFRVLGSRTMGKYFAWFAAEKFI
jgi:ubiquinone/menaquinone biosynthesis C-methylase UbiE